MRDEPGDLQAVAAVLGHKGPAEIPWAAWFCGATERQLRAARTEVQLGDRAVVLLVTDRLPFQQDGDAGDDLAAR